MTQYNDILIKCCDAQGTCDTCNNDMVNVNRCCCRSKMDAQKDSSRCIDEEKQVSRYCTTPQASSGSNGIVTGELDSGEVIQDSDNEVISVGEEMRDGCTVMKQMLARYSIATSTRTSTPVNRKKQLT